VVLGKTMKTWPGQSLPWLVTSRKQVRRMYRCSHITTRHGDGLLVWRQSPSYEATLLSVWMRFLKVFTYG